MFSFRGENKQNHDAADEYMA